MAPVTHDKEITALLVIDPYNDFISEGGKLWDRLKGVAAANNCVPNMLQVLNAARKNELRIFYALHHRYRPGDCPRNSVRVKTQHIVPRAHPKSSVTETRGPYEI